MLDDPKAVEPEFASTATPRSLLTDRGTDFDSATLRRLIDEVRNASTEPTAYNRMHNRHNRS